MNKLRPRNKICFQNNTNPHANLRISKLTKKKWNLLKKKFNYRKEIKPEKRNRFFQKRLFEKQQFKNFYGCIHDYQLKNLFQKFAKKDNKINVVKKFVITLESRLDINVLRLRFAKSIFQSKQLINHGKILVNDKLVTKSNFLLKKGDVITHIN
jgi:ribosomal protein S4